MSFQALPKRLQSIDVFRALTMFLMIFVNDVDGVERIPEWIKHAKETEDALGFADTIFPAFLFILGLSIPFALRNRMNKGEAKSSIAFHVILRSLALLVMGFLHVNLENYNEAALLPQPVWEILITVGFFLIWLDYSHVINKTKQYILQAIGVALLITMAILYKGGTPEQPEGLQPYWWGILGLIGWSYLICALLYLFSNGKFIIQVIALVFFLIFNVASHTDILSFLDPVSDYVWIVGNASMPSFTVAGIVVSLLYTRAVQRANKNFFIQLILFGIAMIAFGFITRPVAGISKINDTPAWVGLCTGISIFVFAFMIWLTDIKGKANWFNIIKPAGTATLTCYLIPYILYSLFEIFNFQFPDVLNYGIGGILRSFAIAFIVIWIAGFLEKRKIRLKL